ncbi:MAG: peptidase [Streptomyces sp.]|nr:peptidase [Streptomyces sp.]
MNVRSGPGTNHTIVRPGTTVSGYYGTSDTWDNIDDSQFVSDAYVLTGSDGYVAPRCGWRTTWVTPMTSRRS